MLQGSSLGGSLGTIVPGGTDIENCPGEPSLAFAPLDNRVNEGTGWYSPGGDVDHLKRPCRCGCSELMSRPKKAVAGYRPERPTPGGSSRADRGRQYCKLRWLLSPKPELSKCIFELKTPRPVIWQRFTSANWCYEPPLTVGSRAPPRSRRSPQKRRRCCSSARPGSGAAVSAAAAVANVGSAAARAKPTHPICLVPPHPPRFPGSTPNYSLQLLPLLNNYFRGGGAARERLPKARHGRGLLNNSPSPPMDPH